MNKELITILVLFIALFAGAFYLFSGFQSSIVSLLHGVKSGYYATLETIDHTIEEHFLQQGTIVKLRGEVETYKQSHLMLHQLLAEQSALRNELNATITLSCDANVTSPQKKVVRTAIPLQSQPRVELARALSYVKFGDLNKVWIEMGDFNESRVYGLVRRGSAAGIVVAKEGKPLALLNADSKSSYAVYVGPNKAPGIVHGRNSDTLLVKYIPTWLTIAPGDEVTTSGLDNLFFTGMKVGKVLSVKLSQGFQEAVIAPYAPSTRPDFYHVIKAVR